MTRSFTPTASLGADLMALRKARGVTLNALAQLKQYGLVLPLMGSVIVALAALVAPM